MVIFNFLVSSCVEKLRLLRQMLQDRIQATSNNQPVLQYAVHSRRLCILNQIAISSIAVLSCMIMIVIVGISIHFIIDGNENTTNKPMSTTTTTRSRRVSSLTIAPTIYIWCIWRFIPDLAHPESLSFSECMEVAPIKSAIRISMVPSSTMPIAIGMKDLVLMVHVLWHGMVWHGMACSTAANESIFASKLSYQVQRTNPPTESSLLKATTLQAVAVYVIIFRHNHGIHHSSLFNAIDRIGSDQSEIEVEEY